MSFSIIFFMLFLNVNYIEKFVSDKTFTWEGAGTPLFSSGANKTLTNKDDSQEKVEDNEADPHFEPIIPLPDKIEVVTGEEDEVRS